MFCAKCGLKIDPDAQFCKNCGHQVGGQEQSVEHTSMTGTEMASSVSPEYEMSSMEEDMATFVGKNNEYYQRKWQENETKKNGITWNFAAFFLSTGWLGYRKMYREIVFIALLFLAIDIVLYLFNYQYSTESFIDPIDNGITIGAAVVIGMLGNRWYKGHVERKVNSIRAVQGNVPEKEMTLKQAGGRSWGGVFLGLLIMVVIYVIPTTFIPTNLTAIEEVKSGSFYEYPDVTIGEMFDLYFEDGTWERKEGNAEFDIIEYRGVRDADGTTHDIQIQFQTDESAEFVVKSITVDERELNDNEILEFLGLISSDYDQ